MKLRSVLASAMILLLTGCSSTPGPSPISTEQQLTGKADGVPSEVLKTLGKRCAGATPMADTSADWNPSDVVNGRPNAHLIQAERVGTDWYIYYEQGGRGKHEVLAVITSSSGSDVSLYQVPSGIHSLSELERLARNGKLSKGSC